MRAQPHLIHSVLWQALDKYELQAYDPTQQARSEFRKSFMEHQAVWWKEYGKATMGAFAAYLVAIFATAIALNRFDQPMEWVLVPVILSLLHATWLIRRNRRLMAPSELEALLPILELDEIERLYGENVLRLYQAELGAETRNQALRELIGLVDDYHELKRHRQHIDEALANTDLAEMDREIDALQQKAAQATDPVAQLAYRESLEIATERRQRSERFVPIQERIEAQVEVMRQTLLALRSEIGQSSTRAIAMTDYVESGLRRSLSIIRTQSEEIETAIQELQRA